MKRDDVRAIFPDATDEQLKAVMDLNGADAEKLKSRNVELENKLKEKQADFDKLNTEFDALKTATASGEDWKAKYEALQAENLAKEKQAEAERILREKAENTNNRFNAALGSKKFTHDAIREAYLKKFGEALENPEYQGKSDTDIIHALTRDDASAFVGVTAVKLAGGRPQSIGGKQYTSKAEIMAIKDSTERQQAIADNISLFK